MRTVKLAYTGAFFCLVLLLGCTGQEEQVETTPEPPVVQDMTIEDPEKVKMQ